MVVGMHWRFTTARSGQSLIGDASDHLVHVHVRLRTTAGLPNGQRELLVIMAGQYGIGGIYNGVCYLSSHRT